MEAVTKKASPEANGDYMTIYQDAGLEQAAKDLFDSNADVHPGGFKKPSVKPYNSNTIITIPVSLKKPTAAGPLPKSWKTAGVIRNTSGKTPTAPTRVVLGNQTTGKSVASVPIASVPVASVPVASVPVASVPVASVPVASVPVASMPVAPVSIKLEHQATPPQPSQASVSISQASTPTASAAGWDTGPSKRRRTSSDFENAILRSPSSFLIRREKGGNKGLRHFSMKVCQKVQSKQTTSYNEVADELVQEFSDPSHAMSPTDQAYDQKNIRRRVYDALNVLMAMNIISKEKKEIRWLGLPTNSVQEYTNLEHEKRRRLERIKQKTQHLQELILQEIAFKNLVERNRRKSEGGHSFASNKIVKLPFILINTDRKTIIDCSISSDKYEYVFNFDNVFEIHDDIEVLKRMGMALGLEQGDCTADNIEKAKRLIPKSLEHYIGEMAGGSSSLDAVEESALVVSSFGSSTQRPIVTSNEPSYFAAGQGPSPISQSGAITPEEFDDDDEISDDEDESESGSGRSTPQINVTS